MNKTKLQTLLPSKTTHLPNFVVRRRVFAKEACAALRQATFERGRPYNSQAGKADRKVTIWELEGEHCSTFMEELARLFRDNNPWNLDVFGIVDPLWVQCYAKGGYTARHSDVYMNDPWHAKLTVVVSLVDSREWKGGVLRVGDEDVPKISAGDCVIFPSFMPHEVSHVTKGERWIAASWASGPHLR